MSIKRLIGRVLAALLIISGITYPIATPVSAAPLINVTDALSDYTAGRTANHTITFNLANDLVKNNKVVIDFPQGFNISTATLGPVLVGGVSANFSIAIDAQKVIINKNGNNLVSPGTLISILLNGIINVLTPGDYHVTVTTAQPNGVAPIDGPTDSNSFSVVSGGTPASTATSVISSVNPSTYGQSVAFTATVTPPEATGTIQFQTDGTDFGSPVALSGANATSGSINTLTAGSHTVTAIYSGDTTYAASTGTVTQTVNKSTPTITWVNPADITYPAPLSSTQLDATASVPGSFAYNPAAGVVLNAGPNQPLSVEFTPSDSTNYNQASAIVHINVIEGSSSITLSNLNQVYDNSPKSVTVITSPSGLSYSLTYNGSATAPTDAGNYAVVATITEPGYSGSANGTLVISAAPLRVAAEAKTKTYGESDPALTYNITSGTLFPGDILSGALTRIAGENVGSYAIQQGTLSAGSNYTLTFTGANLTITKAAASVTLGNLSQVYNGTSRSASVITSPAGLSYSETYDGLSTPPINAGSYTVVATITDSNYTGTTTRTLVISQASLTVAADSKTKVYGQTNPALTYQIISGTLFGGDSITGTLTRAAGENVGSYAIQRGTLSAGGNYDLTFTGANLTITKAALTVRANNTSRAYGEANPNFTASYIGFVNGDDISDLSGTPIMSTTATPTSPVGSYIISVAQGSLSSPNYSFNFVNGTLTIGSNVITVTANSQSKVYGNPDPLLTYSAPNGISFTGTLERVAGENVGSYAINQGTLSAGSEYTINFVIANLTITKATPVINWANPAPITQGTALSSQQLNAAANIQGTLVYSPAIGTILNIGNNQVLHVDFTPADITNYSVTAKNVNIDVLPITIDHYSVSNVASPQTVGVAFNVTIQAQDRNGTNISSITETVNITFNKTDTGATPSSVNVTNGTASLNITLSLAQSDQTITFTGTSGKSGTSNSFTVNTPSTGGGGDLGGGDSGGGTESGGGGGGGNSDRTYLASYMKESPGVFSEEISLKAWDGICNLLISKSTTAKTAEGWAISYITFEPVPTEKQTQPAPVEGNIIGLTYNLGPEGTTFDPPITMSMIYFPEKLPSGLKDSDLVIGYWNPVNQKWESLSGSKVDPVSHTVSAPISHFSSYAILGIPQKTPAVPTSIDPIPASNPVETPPEISSEPIISTPPIESQVPANPVVVKPLISSAMFSLDTPLFPSSQVSPGQRAEVSVVVTNKGDLTGNYTLIFKIGGRVMETQEVTIPGQSNQKVVFTFVESKSGKYLVEINGLSGIIEVPSFLPGWILPFSIISAAVVFGMTILVILRRSNRLSFHLP